MAKLSKEEIEHIAKLSRLELSDKEKELYSHQLSDVLAYVEQLKQVDTGDVEPMANVTGLQNVWREDKVESSDISYEDISINAPEFREGSFVVPGVFE